MYTIEVCKSGAHWIHLRKDKPATFELKFHPTIQDLGSTLASHLSTERRRRDCPAGCA